MPYNMPNQSSIPQAGGTYQPMGHPNFNIGAMPLGNGPVMTPGGGGTGAPIQAPAPMPPQHIPAGDGAGTLPTGVMPMNPAAVPPTPAVPPMNPQRDAITQALMTRFGNNPNMSGLMGAIQDWRAQRPTFSSFDGPGSFRGALQDWRHSRPDFQSFMSPAPPVPGA